MSRVFQGTLLAMLSLAAAQIATAATVTVDVGTDPIDIDWQTATIADLPGPDGVVSFSEAMIVTNNTPGHDTIEFAIPQSDWQMQWLLPGRAVIQSSYTYFWRAFDEVTIDGRTQTEFTGDSNPDGAEVALFGGELYLNVDNCEVYGLDYGAFTLNGSNSVAEGNTGGINITVYGGSGSLIKGNVGGTLKLDRSSDNVVVGNTFLRVRNLGWVGGGQANVNNRIGGANPEDRNFITGLGSYSSEGYPGGFSIQLFDAVDTVIENNSIGSTPDGMASGTPAASVGIRFEGENHNTVIRDNRIAGVLGIGIGPHHAGQLFGWALLIGGSGSGIEITGNTIGLNAEGDPLLGSVVGIDVGASTNSTISDITIGGLEPGQGNTIAGHRFNGISVAANVPQARIAGNSIYANVALGIDLLSGAGVYGLTTNDPGDGDTGGNGLQNFPEIMTATASGASIEIQGSLRSLASRDFTLDFFASEECDANGYGEGRLYLGSSVVTTNGAGDADFTVVLPAVVEDGWVVTATATLEPLGATSEFSQCVSIEGGNTSSTPLDVVTSGIRLGASVPNPFRTATTLGYELPSAADVRVDVFDAGGRLVRNLERGERAAGVHQIEWDGRDDRGALLSGGVYFYQLAVGGERLTQRTLLVR
ncbi:MAG: hypothetical protein H6682_13650 [Candidatus Eisenbacteria bacterium]|nr:hypothetical protein [Candidatus Eisenbacteria bacterium]